MYRLRIQYESMYYLRGGSGAQQYASYTYGVFAGSELFVYGNGLCCLILQFIPVNALGD